MVQTAPRGRASGSFLGYVAPLKAPTAITAAREAYETAPFATSPGADRVGSPRARVTRSR